MNTFVGAAIVVRRIEPSTSPSPARNLLKMGLASAVEETWGFGVGILVGGPPSGGHLFDCFSNVGLGEGRTLQQSIPERRSSHTNSLVSERPGRAPPSLRRTGPGGTSSTSPLRPRMTWRFYYYIYLWRRSQKPKRRAGAIRKRAPTSFPERWLRFFSRNFSEGQNFLLSQFSATRR